MIEIIQPDFEYEDERGKLTQLVRDGFAQFNIIFSKAGVSRGDHFHKSNKEAFYVISGEFDLFASKNNRTEKIHFRSGDMFLIPPYVVHSFYYEADTLLASMYDVGVEMSDGSKDIFTPERESLFQHL